MSIWPSILCSPPKGLQTSRYNEPSEILRHHCAKGRQKQLPANEKAKVAHSRRDLRARVKCAKAMMKAKYEYRMTVQEARAERCTELEESEAIYTEALNGNVAALSLQCTTLHQEHTEHMWELEACALMTENKSH